MSQGKARCLYLGRSGLVQSSNAPDWSFIYRASTVKDQEFSVGDRVVIPDGRVFRYAKSGTGGVLSSFGAQSSDMVLISVVAPAQTTLTAPGFPATTGRICGAVGSWVVTITVASGDGVAADGVVAEDEFRGGYIVIGNQGSSAQNRGIIGNTAVASGGGTSVVTLDGPLTTAVTAATTYIEVLHNPYSNMRLGSAVRLERSSFLGIPAVTSTVGQNFWLQTWGPTWIVPSGTPGSDQPGYANNDRDVFFVGDGSIYGGHAATVESGFQRAGTIIQSDVSGAGGPPFVMLQISC